MTQRKTKRVYTKRSRPTQRTARHTNKRKSSILWACAQLLGPPLVPNFDQVVIAARHNDVGVLPGVTHGIDIVSVPTNARADLRVNNKQLRCRP